MSLNKEFLGDWYTNFEDLWKSKGVNDLLYEIQKQRGLTYVVPEPSDVWKPFAITRPDNIKLIILGHEPYTETWNGVPYASGLTFDTSRVSYYNVITKTAWLSKVLKDYQAYEPNHFNVNLLEGDFKRWGDKGILLLHVALTAEIGKTGSHLELWTPFIKGLLARMKQSGIIPPILSLSDYATKVVKSEDWPKVEQVVWNENIFDQMEILLGHSIEW